MICQIVTACQAHLIDWFPSSPLVSQFLNQSMSPEHSDSDSLPMSSPVDSKPLIDHSIQPHKENEM